MISYQKNYEKYLVQDNVRVTNHQGLQVPESDYLRYLRGFSIFGIILQHLCRWIYMPYSDFIFAPFVPIFFFLSGSVTFHSYKQDGSLWIYYSKKMVKLLVPYYLICIFSLMVYVVMNSSLPVFDMQKVLMWLKITPSNEIMPFNLGQVWFLQTLVIISIVAPIYFYLIDKNVSYLLILIAIIIVVSTLRLFFRIDHYFGVGNHNFYKPLTNSIFYILGLVYFSRKFLIRNTTLIWIFSCCVVVSIAITLILNINIAPSSHGYSPDLYYIAVNLSVIAFVFIIREPVTNIIQRLKQLQFILRFFDKHTFSIFLLHSFSIFIAESCFNLVHPQQYFILYGITKLAVVLIITCSLAVPFTWITNFLTIRAVKFLVKKNYPTASSEISKS